MLRSLSAVFAVFFFAAVVRADGQTYAVIVTGAPGSAMYARHYQDRVARFAKVLTDAGVAADRLTVLPNDATAKVVTDALSKAVAKPAAADQFILILIGHGEAAGDRCTLMLPGPDLEMKTVADLLKPLRCRSQIVLNFAASSGDAMALLSQPRRINLAAGEPGKVNDNDFAEFVLQTLEKPGDRPTLLDLYNTSTQAYAKWVVRQKIPPEEGKLGWRVEGKESTAIFRKLYDSPDVPENRKFIPSPLSDKPDAPNVPVAADGSAFWANRRLIGENPTFDDAGQAPPASALTAKGFAAITPSPKLGAVAASTVLGRAAAVPPRATEPAGDPSPAKTPAASSPKTPNATPDVEPATAPTSAPNAAAAVEPSTMPTTEP